MQKSFTVPANIFKYNFQIQIQIQINFSLLFFSLNSRLISFWTRRFHNINDRMGSVLYGLV